MNKIFISESNCNKNNLTYLYNSLSQSILDFNAHANLSIDEKRASVEYCIDNKFKDFFKLRLEDKICEIIAISYKYAFLKDKVTTSGLTACENKYLIAALIAADFDDDMAYIKGRLKNIDIYTIDGFFNFRLAALKLKWEEIASYIPAYFSAQQLKEFIVFLINEGKKNKKVLIDGGLVFDKYYNLQEKSKLLGDTGCNIDLICELILSGCDKIEIKGALDLHQQKYIIDFYGENADFSKNYFS